MGSWLFRFPTFNQQNFRKKYLFAQIRLELDINEALDASEMNNYGPQKIKKEKKSTKLEPENARCIFFFKMKMDCKYQTFPNYGKENKYVHLANSGFFKDF